MSDTQSRGNEAPVRSPLVRWVRDGSGCDGSSGGCIGSGNRGSSSGVEY